MRIFTLLLFLCIFAQSCEKDNPVTSEESVVSNADDLKAYRAAGYQVFSPSEVDEILGTAEGLPYLEEAKGNISKAFANYSFDLLLKETKEPSTFEKSSGDYYFITAYAQYKLTNGFIVNDYVGNYSCTTPNCVTTTLLSQVEGASAVLSGEYCAYARKNADTPIEVDISYGPLNCGFPNGFGEIYTFGMASLNVNALTGAVTTSVNGDHGCGIGIGDPQN